MRGTGDRYEGPVVAGVKAGWGKCNYANGDRCVRCVVAMTLRASLRVCGVRSVSRECGGGVRRYEGMFTDDIRGGGVGILDELAKSSDDVASRFHGDWQHDWKSCIGKMNYADGVEYVGTVRTTSLAFSPSRFSPSSCHSVTHKSNARVRYSMCSG